MARTREFKRNRLWDVVVLTSLFGFVLVEPLWRDFRESRFYRDLAGITPYKNVKVFGTVLEAHGIIISGSMIKVRCEFAELYSFVDIDTGVSIRMPVDTMVEEDRGVSGNRAPSEKSQMWGPWMIRYNGGLGKAVGWELHTKHVNCPDDPKTQFNLFASGKWETTRKD